MCLHGYGLVQFSLWYTPNVVHPIYEIGSLIFLELSDYIRLVDQQVIGLSRRAWNLWQMFITHWVKC